MICPKCGFLLPDGIDKCTHCGATLEEAPTPKDYTVIKNTVLEEPISLGETRIEESTIGETILVPFEEKPIYGWLVIIEGLDQWREFRVPDEEGQFLIGRNFEGCAIKLRDKGVEKFHASLRVRDGRLFLTDLDTESGTYLNDKEIAREEVKDGDIIRVGEAVLKFRKF